MKKRFTEEQIVAILREAESGHKPVGEVCRKHAISAPTFYVWRRKYGPMAERYFRSLGKLRAHAIAAGRFHVNGEGDFSDEDALATAAEHALNQFQPDWRKKVRDGEHVFELQVPEVWTALHVLSERRPVRASRRPRTTAPANRVSPARCTV
jgi:hypothetical protein